MLSLYTIHILLATQITKLWLDEAHNHIKNATLYLVISCAHDCLTFEQFTIGFLSCIVLFTNNYLRKQNFRFCNLSINKKKF